MNRRALLQAAGAVVAWFGWHRIAHARPAIGVPGTRAEAWLAALAPIGGTAQLHRLGAQYLAAYPAEADVGRLEHALGGTVSMLPAAALDQRIARDWKAHDVAVVGGWVLARTEARLCAALVLAGRPA